MNEIVEDGERVRKLQVLNIYLGGFTETHTHSEYNSKTNRDSICLYYSLQLLN